MSTTTCLRSSVLGIAQISRVFKENDRRLLFRGWSRLCLHVASHTADGAVAATAPSTGSTAGAEAGATETNVTRQRQRLEASEKKTRANARRADAMEKRAVAAEERVKEFESAAGIPTTGGALLERAEEAERAVEQQERRQAVQLVSKRGCKGRTRFASALGCW